MPKVNAQPFQRIILTISKSFQGGINPLSNFLSPYIPTAKAEGFTAKSGKPPRQKEA
jgi:hypothetical protein